MSTVEKWSVALLVIYGIGSLWDLVDPRAMEVDWNSGGRLIVSVCSAIAALTVPLLVVGASALVIALVVVSLLLLAALAVMAR